MTPPGWRKLGRMDASSVREMPELELALLRRGLDELAADCERCRHCGRTPLIGERVWVYESRRDPVRALPRSDSASGRRLPRSSTARSSATRCASPTSARRPERRSLRELTPARSGHIHSGGVDPITVSTTIAKPREQVFEYLADIANHAEFTDHYLTDWHLTRVDSYGTGAGARFRIKAPLNRFSWADLTFSEVQQPYRIVERGRGGKYNRIRMLGTYTLSPGAGRTRPRWSTRSRPSRRCCPTGCWRRSAGARGPAARPPGRCAACGRSSRRTGTAAGAPRWRRAEALDSRAAVTACCAATSADSPPPLACAAVALGWAPAAQGEQPDDRRHRGQLRRRGAITYQVQLSRQLNPYATEDRRVLRRRLARPPPTPDQMWFAVFLWAKNETHQTADDQRLVRHRRHPGQQVLPGADQPAGQPVRLDAADAAAARAPSRRPTASPPSAPPRAPSCCSS